MPRDLHKADRYTEAQDWYARAEAQGKQDKWVGYWSAKAHEEAGDNAAARGGYTIALDRDPNHKFSLYRMALLEANAGRMNNPYARKLKSLYPLFAAENQMKRTAFLLLCVVATGATAQSTLNLEAAMAPGYRFKVFNSPDDYVRTPGDKPFADSLLVNDAFLNGKFSANVKWKRGIHRFRLVTDAEILRYQNTPSAHATELQGQLKYDRRASSDRRQGASLRLRKQDRLGLNVLGSELLTPFSFWQAAGTGYVLRKNPADHTFKLEAAYSFKDYQACDDCGQQGENVALDQHEWSIEAQRVWLLGRAHEAKRTLVLSVRYRDRQYTDWFNYDLLDDAADWPRPPSCRLIAWANNLHALGATWWASSRGTCRWPKALKSSPCWSTPGVGTYRKAILGSTNTSPAFTSTCNAVYGVPNCTPPTPCATTPTAWPSRIRPRPSPRSLTPTCATACGLTVRWAKNGSCGVKSPVPTVPQTPVPSIRAYADRTATAA